MAHEGDVDTENQRAAVDEQTPLLISEEQLTNEEQEEDPKEPEPTRLSWYLWRAFWVVVLVLIHALFIKGWIDAGSDVNACTTT
jgi:hypothetical protein